MSAPKATREIGCCQIPLKGVVDYPYVMNELEPPAWLVEEAKLEGWYKKLEEWKLGSVEGKVLIAKVPRYRQIGDIYHVDHRHHYLIVNILNIDQIVTVDNIKELDTYVEVTFDRTSRRTRLLKKTVAPNYDSLIAIPLRFNNKNEVDFQNFIKKGSIYIDVWGKTEDPIYIGGCIINPYDIFYNEKNLTRPTVKMEHVDLESNVKTNYDAIVYKGSKKLYFLHDDQRVSTISFSIWTYPNLLGMGDTKNITVPPAFNTTRNLPVQLAKKYEKLKGLYINVLKTANIIPSSLTNIETAQRYFNYELRNQRKESHFLPTLLTSIKSPYLAESPNAVFHYVRCIPFIHKKENIAFTPDFTLQLKGGNALDHCLVLCSLFLGVPVVAFVCFGTLWDNQKHSWVTTFEIREEKNYGIVKFWETTTGNVYVLKKRFLDINKLKGIEIKLNESKYKKHLRDGYLQKQKKFHLGEQTGTKEAKRAIKLMLRKKEDAGIPQGGPLLPYKTIDLIFNNKNIYVNLQSPDPLQIWYDFWRFDLWYPFTSVDYKMQPCFNIKSFTHKMEDMELDRIAKELRSTIEKNITVFRASRNLSTRWNRDETLELFLQIGLELLHQLNTARNEDVLLAKVKIEDWKKALYYKVPQSHRILGFPYHFNTCKSKFISDKLISTLAILESRDRSLCLSFAVCIYSLPGDFISVYIYIITCVKITQRELKKMEIANEKAQRKAEQKKLKKGLLAAQGVSEITADTQDLSNRIEEEQEEKEKENEIEKNEIASDGDNKEKEREEDEEQHKMKKKKSKGKDKKYKKTFSSSNASKEFEQNETNLFEGEEQANDRTSLLSMWEKEMASVEKKEKENENKKTEGVSSEKENDNVPMDMENSSLKSTESKKGKKKKQRKNSVSLSSRKSDAGVNIEEMFYQEEKERMDKEIEEAKEEVDMKTKKKSDAKKKKHKVKKNISFKETDQIAKEKSQTLENKKIFGILKKKKKKKEKKKKKR